MLFPISSLRESSELSLKDKFYHLSWMYIIFIVLLSCTGFFILYSAAGGSFQPYASKQIIRFCIFFVFMIGIALTDIRFWYKNAYLIYLAVLVLLIWVQIAGHVGMGAQRWINLGFMQLQPSEFMKIALVLALSRYLSFGSLQETQSMSYIVLPTLMVAIPAALVFKQPDLGTTVLLILGAVILYFLAGIQMWKFIAVGVAGLSIIPIGWHFLHDYQKNRVLIFLNPESDPSDKGYHILQSKITFGSGGIFGKGYLKGTQSGLNFLPEKHTDFIFTVFAEEFGLVGCLSLLVLFLCIIFYGFVIAFRSANLFGRLLVLGLSTNLFLYVFINIAMVLGLIPVVGVPLPMISYGGSIMLTLMISFGLIECVNVHNSVQIGRRIAYDY
ncbi:MAG: rod shape-determining protein RodA [Alphaproteobacteria bacterium]|nr:rod shape-determining protein RodA [Alphaproteobacteria bacterium]